MFISQNHRKEIRHSCLISSFLQAMVSLQFSPFDPFQSFLICILLSLLCTVRYYLPYKCGMFLPSLGQAVLCMVFTITLLCVTPWQTAITDPAPSSYLSSYLCLRLPSAPCISALKNIAIIFHNQMYLVHLLQDPPTLIMTSSRVLYKCNPNNKKKKTTTLHCTFTAIYNLQEEVQ